MASKKDTRRPDLVIPYVQPKQEGGSDIGSSMTTMLPMSAMFMRNKLIGWVAVIFSVQSWLSETPNSANPAKQPAYFTVGMSVMSLLLCYMPLFMPPPNAGGATPAGAAAPVPPVAA